MPQGSTISQCCEAAQPTVPHYAPCALTRRTQTGFRRCEKGVAVAPHPTSVHTHDHDPQKCGADGTRRDDILMTALLLWNFVFTLLNVLRDLVPAVTLFSSLIYAFGSLTVMVFFFVFHRTQKS